MKIRGVPCLLGLVYAAGAYAQAVIGSGTVTGTVLDYTGTGIPDVTIVLVNDQIRVRREMDTSLDGLFSAGGVIPAAGYNLKVSRKGFLDIEYNNFEVPLGHTLHFKVSMAQEPALAQRGPQKMSIELEDVTWGVQNVLSTADLDALPARDRNVSTLVPLSLFVVPSDQNGVLAFHSQPATNAYLTDGILTQDTYFYIQPPISPPAPQEAVDEMQVVSATAPAEFQHARGGWINIITRRGGTSFHGALYDYFNTHSFNAADRFAPGFLPPGWQHQTGANAGGPLGITKFYWFLNAEYLDRHSEELNRTFNQLIANPTGTAVSPSSCTATVSQCSAALRFLNAQLNRTVDTSLISYSGLGRLDWRPNAFNTINIDADAVHRRSPNGTDIDTVSPNGGLLGANGTYNDESRYAKTAYTATWSGNFVNEIRGNWYHDRFSDYLDRQLLPSSGALGINIAGTSFGGNPQLPLVLSEERYQIVDNASASIGPHIVRIGVDLSLNDDIVDQVMGSAGAYFYPTVTSFALDFSGNTKGLRDYSSFQQGFGQPVANLHTKVLGIYAQDTWSPIRRMTLVMGLDWEKPFTPKPPYINTTYYQTGSINTPFIDVAPRIGLTYQLDNRTVIRGGVGGYYQPYSGQLLHQFFIDNDVFQLPITVNPNLKGAPIFPAIIPAAHDAPTGSADVVFSITKLRTPLAAEGTAVIERQLGSGMILSLNYFYSRGIQLWVPLDQNLATPPPVTRTYTIDNAAGSPVGTYTTGIYNVSNTSFAHAIEVENKGGSSYNGVALQLRKRLSRGIAVQASYTWSRAMDNVSGTPIVDGVIPSATSPGAFGADMGKSAFNQPNRVIVEGTWRPTLTSSKSWPARYLINGWQLSAIATLASGLAETPLVDVNGRQFSGALMADLTTVNGSGGWARAPFEPIGSLPNGAEYNVDVRLTREIPITERFKGLLMFEGYNAFNMQYNTSVNTIAYLATAGVLTPVPGAGVGNTAAGYPWGDNARHLQIALKFTF